MTDNGNYNESGPWKEWARYVLLNIEDLTRGLSELEKNLDDKKLEDSKELREVFDKINDLKETLTTRLVDIEKSFEVMKTKLIVFSGIGGIIIGVLLDKIIKLL